MGFREFTRDDWDAFAGCEDANPLICDDIPTVCIVIDGASINVNHVDGEDPEGIPIYACEFSTREKAHDVAYALSVLAKEMSISGMANVLEAMLGEPVGTC